jgi:hypothetical protein
MSERFGKEPPRAPVLKAGALPAGARLENDLIAAVPNNELQSERTPVLFCIQNPVFFPLLYGYIIPNRNWNDYALGWLFF